MSISKPISMFFAVAVVTTGFLSFERFETASPQIHAPEFLQVNLEGEEIDLSLEDLGSGLREVSASAEVFGKNLKLMYRSFAGSLVFGEGPKSAKLKIRVVPKELGISEEGKFILKLEARDWSWLTWWRGNITKIEIPILVDLTPPSISSESGLTYVRRGGSAVAVYTVSEKTKHSGVSVDDEYFPGFLLSTDNVTSGDLEKHDNRYISFFTLPWKASADPEIVLIATDLAGNINKVDFPARIKERRFVDVRITLPKKFIDNKIPKLATHLGRTPSDDYVKAFILINEEERFANEEKIKELVTATSSARLWSGAFTQMRNSAVTSRYAENRTYLWKGEAVSRAIHSGYDLASTANAPIDAANSGRVLFAGDMGIYGNCLLIDHGLGLFTLYAHLSQISVRVDQHVDKGSEVGRSGKTGLAGGDHLHFSVLVNGHYVDPKEWWDPKWVNDHVEKWLD